MLARPLAFLRRDLAVALSYRLSFISQFVGIFVGVASFYFVSRLIGPAANPYLGEYGGSYFGYVLVGLALIGFQSTGLTSFSSAITYAQGQGTLEAMLVTPTSLGTIMVSSTLFNFCMTALNVVVYLVVSAAVFGADLGQVNVPSALLVLLLTILVFSAGGILSAAFLMVFKRGNPVAWIFGGLSTFVGGTLFPVALLPAWLQLIAHLLPFFYALRAMRLAVLEGATVSQLRGDLLILSAFAVVLLPLCIWAFKRGVHVAKTDGTLATY